MAVIGIPHNDPWVVARWACRQLLEPLIERCGNEEDAYTLKQALALDGLHFDLLEPAQSTRLAQALALAADELRLDLIATESDEPRDAEFAEYLSTLEMRLHDVYE